MEQIHSNDSFDAFKTEFGIQINEKKNSAKKIGIITIVMGAAFLAVSFINIRAIIDWEMIASIFYYTFFYGGILLLALGAILFVAKGLMGGEPISTFNSETKEFTQRGKIIPFSEMSEIKMQASEVMGRKMVAILFRRNGKRKALVAGTLILNDTSDLEDLLEQLNELIR